MNKRTGGKVDKFVRSSITIFFALPAFPAFLASLAFLALVNYAFHVYQ
ncbi:MAG: hypothetical protein NTW16_14275 [Bacteroidetes bacterium]|nr:hypothetical protein [Bacteroidota bacterium]